MTVQTVRSGAGRFGAGHAGDGPPPRSQGVPGPANWSPGPGAVRVRSLASEMELSAREGRTVVFGRSRLDAHVCVGADDPQVSRCQGTVTHRQGSWLLHNTGRLPMRLPRARLLFPHEPAVPLPCGYTPVFIQGSAGRAHLLEIHVAGDDGDRPAPVPDVATQPPRLWRLTADERLALAVLGSRYLRHDTHPQPLTWHQTAVELAVRQPDAGWTAKRVERLVAEVRARLSRHEVPGLTREEVGEPVGNLLNHNLLRELILSTTLTPADLRDTPTGQPSRRSPASAHRFTP